MNDRLTRLRGDSSLRHDCPPRVDGGRNRPPTRFTRQGRRLKGMNALTRDRAQRRRSCNQLGDRYHTDYRSARRALARSANNEPLVTQLDRRIWLVAFSHPRQSVRKSALVRLLAVRARPGLGGPRPERLVARGRFVLGVRDSWPVRHLQRHLAACQ
jgi:hypothetical protein